ncbi:histidine kinase [Bacillus sp. LL01]|uniref:histidine kinase n=1 Tax=Bacillus sp. LL01 TaxID=1665556 RepID=UPI00064D4686|nr:histidine kinase [Bacillus sp. LL01]KMJ58013.1 histidine kinase [Bacillus sp. LL01]
MKENILVCVSNPKHVEKLIQRGKIIAQTFGGDCFVLFVYTVPYDDLDLNQIRTKQFFKSIADKYGVPMLIEYSKGKKVSAVIAETTTKHGITQVILGQPVQTKLEMMIKHALINEIFSKVTGVDIHVVEVGRENIPQPETYDRGLHAHLIHKGNIYEIAFDTPCENAIKGIFFKESSTDFLNGYFVIHQGEDHKVLKVNDGLVEFEALSST